MSDENRQDDQQSGGENPVSEARRRLLRVAVYTPPMILSTLAMNRRAWAGSVHGCFPVGEPHH